MLFPMVSSLLTACWRELSTLKHMLYALTASTWALSWSLSGSLGGNEVMFVDEGQEQMIGGAQKLQLNFDGT